MAATTWTTWGKNDNTKNNITFKVGIGDIVTVSVNKAALSRNSCGIEMPYNGIRNKTYRYSFEAWTSIGTRELVVCFGSDKNSSGHTWHPHEIITINSRKQIYEFERIISDSWTNFVLSFNCGDIVGEFYIKIISISPLQDIEDNVAKEII